MTDVKLLPLPEPHWIGMDTCDAPGPRHYTADQMHAYARANVAHATAPLQAEVEALRAEVETLRALAGCAYQMAGMHDAPLVWLDRLSEAANGDALPDADTLMDELLPYQPDAVCEAEAENERLRAEVREAREFRDKMANAIGNDQLRRFIEKHGEPVPLTIRMQESEARADKLRAEVATWEGLHASEVQVRQRWQARAERLAKERREFAKPEMAIGLYTEDRND